MPASADRRRAGRRARRRDRSGRGESRRRREHSRADAVVMLRQVGDRRRKLRRRRPTGTAAHRPAPSRSAGAPAAVLWRNRRCRALLPRGVVADPRSRISAGRGQRRAGCARLVSRRTGAQRAGSSRSSLRCRSTGAARRRCGCLSSDRRSRRPAAPRPGRGELGRARTYIVSRIHQLLLQLIRAGPRSSSHAVRPVTCWRTASLADGIVAVPVTTCPRTHRKLTTIDAKIRAADKRILHDAATRAAGKKGAGGDIASSIGPILLVSALLSPSDQVVRGLCR
jgi:hypothetical protein